MRIRQLRPVQGREGLRRIFVSGCKRYRGVEVAVRHGNSGVCRRGDSRRHSRYYFEGNSGGSQLLRLFPAAAENERIAALEPYHVLAFAPQADEQRADLILRERMFPRL